VCAFCRMTERAAARMRVRRHAAPETPFRERPVPAHPVAPAG